MSLCCLILCWEYPPIVEGGLGRHVGRLAPELVRQGVEVHVLTRGAGPSACAEKVDGVVVHRVAEPRRPDRIGPFVAWVGRMNDDMRAAGLRLADGLDFDLIHGHDWLVASAGEGLADRLGTPLVMTIHATEHGRHRGWVAAEPQSYIHAVEHRGVHQATRLIACSDYMRGHLADVFGADERRISVIPNGVDPAPAVADATAGRALRDRVARPEETVVLLVGRLVYEKGFQLALEALPGLLDRLGPLRLLIAGAGIHEAELRGLCRELGLDAHVSFLGWVGPAELDELYSVADACLVPSIYEPFGLVALEAMARGCPCVVADTGGLCEVVPHGAAGLRFRPRDSAALAAALERILRDRALRERLVAGARDHVAGFAWPAVGARTAAVYRELCPLAAAAMLGSEQ